MIKWTHILDKQPEHGESIIQIDRPYRGHYGIEMRNYHQALSWQEVLDFYSNSRIGLPDFWWMPSKDFPFPDKDIQSTLVNTSPDLSPRFQGEYSIAP